MGPQKGIKQQKVAKNAQDKRSSSVDSREELNRADVRLPQRTWSPRLEVDGTAILWNASIREFQKGCAGYIAETLEQPLLLLRDMEVYKRFKLYFRFFLYFFTYVTFLLSLGRLLSKFL